MCVGLERRVRSGVLGVEARFPYHPHVTIAHDADDASMDRAVRELADFRADVPISSMALHERRAGRWSLLREFAFSGPAPA